MHSPEADGPRRAVRDLLRHPFLQSVIAGLLGMALIVVVSIVASRNAGENEAMTEARQLTQVVATTLVAPNITEGLIAGDPAAVAALDQLVTERVIKGTTVRVKVWDAEGRIIYSDEPRLIGEVYPLEAEKAESLWSGSAVSEISDLEGPENRFEADRGQLLEVYLPVDGPDGEPVLYEAYFDFSEVEDASSRIRDAFLPIVIGSLVIAQVMHLLLAWGLNRRLSRARRDREELLQRAIDSSDIARRRIAGDLHDGVVQDLVGTSYAISAAAETAAGTSPELAADLRTAAAGTRRGLQSLRSLLVDIYPANLKTQGLDAAIADLMAPAMGLGIETECAMRGDLDAPIESTALIYRVVRESVRNVLRHADASTLTVTVDGDPDRLYASVVDDGRGFDTAASSENGNGDGHIGLRLISDLASDAGARLSVESAVGAGTTIMLEVPR
jgi:two-component system NarL family sensor kinase